MNNSFPNTNPVSILSLILGLLAIFSCCLGAVPIPFTGFVCFPLSFLTALLALIFGFVGLNQISQRGGTGKPVAWTGIIVGASILLAMVCAVIVAFAFFHWDLQQFPLPSIFNKYQL